MSAPNIGRGNSSHYKARRLDGAAAEATTAGGGPDGSGELRRIGFAVKEDTATMQTPTQRPTTTSGRDGPVPAAAAGFRRQLPAVRR